MSNNPFMDQAEPTASGTASRPGSDLTPIIDRIAQLEGTGQNPRSSARGVGQFTDATLLDTVRRHNPNSGLSDQQVLALKDDPGVMRDMLGHLVTDNAQALTSAGVDPTPGRIYLANHFGPAGAVKILNANPGTPIESVVGSDVVSANPNLAGKSAGDVVALLDAKMEGAGSTPPPASGPAAPNPFMDAANGVASSATADPGVQPSPLPQTASPETLSGWLSRSAHGLASLDPVTNALVNGQGDVAGSRGGPGESAHQARRSPGRI